MAKSPQKQNQQMRITMLFAGILGLLLLVHLMVKPQDEPKTLKFSEFIAAASLPDSDPNHVAEVTFKENEIVGVRVDKSTFKTYGPNDADIRKTLSEKGVKVNFEPPEEMSWWKTLLINSLPLIIILFLFVFFMRQLQIGGGKAMSFGKSRAKLLNENQTRVTFEDIAGIDEAKQELEEIIQRVVLDAKRSQHRAVFRQRAEKALPPPRRRFDLGEVQLHRRFAAFLPQAQFLGQMQEKWILQRIVADIQSDQVRLLHQRQHVVPLEGIRGERQRADTRALQRGHDARQARFGHAVLTEIQNLQLALRGQRRADGQRSRIAQARAKQIEALHLMQSFPRGQRLAAGRAERVAAEIEFLHARQSRQERLERRRRDPAEIQPHLLRVHRGAAGNAHRTARGEAQ